jgi:hypothetical protein
MQVNVGGDQRRKQIFFSRQPAEKASAQKCVSCVCVYITYIISRGPPQKFYIYNIYLLLFLFTFF